jgi:hypothetical protein
MSGKTRLIYRSLLDIIWDYDSQYSIPNDPELISKLLKIPAAECEEAIQEMLSTHARKLSTSKPNFSESDGVLTSKYLYKEKLRVNKSIKQKSLAGKKGAENRWK